jgi:hypothetical protein
MKKMSIHRHYIYNSYWYGGQYQDRQTTQGPWYGSVEMILPETKHYLVLIMNFLLHYGHSSSVSGSIISTDPYHGPWVVCLSWYKKNWLPRYNWNIIESDIKHHNPNPQEDMDISKHGEKNWFKKPQFETVLLLLFLILKSLQWGHKVVLNNSIKGDNNVILSNSIKGDNNRHHKTSIHIFFW